MIVLADAPLYPYPSTSFFFILPLSHLPFYLLVRISVFFGRLYLFFQKVADFLLNGTGDASSFVVAGPQISIFI